MKMSENSGGTDKKLSVNHKRYQQELRRTLKISLPAVKLRIFLKTLIFLYAESGGGDRQILAKQLNISPHQLSYVTNSGEGEGLIFYGNVIIPFKDRFNHNLRLYSLMTTRPSDLENMQEKALRIKQRKRK